MLKSFIACKSPRERVEFFDKSAVSAWSEEELVSVAEITGIPLQEGMDKVKIYMTLLLEMRSKAQQIA